MMSPNDVLALLMDADWVPASLKSVLPGLWLVVVVLLASLALYGLSILAKRFVRWVGKRRLKGRDEAYEGSVWDLADSATQFMVVALGIPFVLGLTNMEGLNPATLFGQYGPGIISAIVILTVAIFIARKISRSIRNFGLKAQQSHRGDGTLFAFVGSLITYIIIGIAIILALTQVGVQTTSLIALVGAAGLAIALALQDTLKAVASGVMLAIFRPYRIGDWVNVAGMEGEVTDITPFRTTIKPPTNQAVSLPNDQVWTNPISNSSRFARRRLDLYLDISYEDDVDVAIQVTSDAVNALSRTLAKQDTWVGIHSFQSSSVQLRCRVWVAMPEYVQMRSDCLRAIKTAYAENGITIPYPHQVEIQRFIGDTTQEAVTGSHASDDEGA